MSIKTRLEVIEKKVRPKPRPRPLEIRFIMPGSLEEKEFRKSMESLKKAQDQDQVSKFNFEDPVMIMFRPGQKDDGTFEDAGPDVLTVRVVDPKAQDQVAKQEPQPEQEPSDDEFEGEIQRLEQKKAATLDKEEKNMNISRDGR